MGIIAFLGEIREYLVQFAAEWVGGIVVEEFAAEAEPFGVV